MGITWKPVDWNPDSPTYGQEMGEKKIELSGQKVPFGSDSGQDGPKSRADADKRQIFGYVKDEAKRPVFFSDPDFQEYYQVLHDSDKPEFIEIAKENPNANYSDVLDMLMDRQREEMNKMNEVMEMME